jgi:endonuclease-3
MGNRAKSGPEERREAQRVALILRGFEESYPDATCALEHGNPLQLLVATILSAQCTDERVNRVTKSLFRKYRTPEDYAESQSEVLEGEIRPTGFFRNKTRSIRSACRLIVEKFGGKVPDTMEELTQLPGVARKTANVVLGVAFKKAGGVVVDTHVTRVSRRLGLSKNSDPEKIERDLMKLIPRDKWIWFAHAAILHGRQICKARRPLCAACPVEKVCRSEDKLLMFPSAGRRA